MSPSLIYTTGLTHAMSVLSKLLREAPEIDSRYGKTKEIIQVGISCSDPLDRLNQHKERKEDIIAQIAEVVWIIGGENRIKYLTPFLKRAPEFSDDGEIWRSGYGSRIRNFPSYGDQLDNVINILKTDLYSRRAFLVISFPRIDQTAGIDIACNNFVSFLVRKENGVDKLFMTIHQRSSDYLWGFSGINYFEFTFLQEFIANQLGIECGNYLLNIMSSHIYEPHYEKLNKIAEEEIEYREDIYCPKVKFDSLDQFDKCFELYKRTLDSILGLGDPILFWKEFKTKLDSIIKYESLVYFEIPILYLLLESDQFLEYIKSYIDETYLKQTSLFYEKVSQKFNKRSKNKLIGN